VPPVAEEELERVTEPRLFCWLVLRVADDPEDRVVLPEERVTEVPEERVLLPVVLRVVLPEDRVVEDPEDRVVLPEVLRVVLPVLRFRLSCWVAEDERVVLPLVERVVEEPLERVVEDPVDRVVLPEVLRVVVPVLRFRLSCWLATAERVELPLTERLTEVPDERVLLLPDERLTEEPEERVELPEVLRVVVELWAERVVLPVDRERVWAIISGAVSMASAIAKVTAVVKILLIASKVLKLSV